jgi:hypothetical protein
MRCDVNQAYYMRVLAGIGDDCATIAVTNENRRAVLLQARG